MKKTYIPWCEIEKRLEEIDKEGNKVFGVPRGGAVVACLLRNATRVMSHKEANIILDDIVDSGETRNEYILKTCGKRFFAVIDKQMVEEHKTLPWVVFPWEHENEVEEFDEVLKKTLTRFIEMNEEYLDPSAVEGVRAAYKQHAGTSKIVAKVMMAQNILTLGPIARDMDSSLGEAVVQGIQKIRSFTEIEEGAE